MSNLFNLEPQAFGSIKFKTNFGDIEIELFTKQCPKNTSNFVQLCIDGFYNGTIFQRVEKDFIAIGGAKSEEEDNGYEDELFPDEFHSRLKFTRRGLLATANTEKNANGSKIFFTLGATPELQNKHTIFGRVKGNSVYTLVNLNDCQVDDDCKPYSQKIIEQVIIEENPYPDLKPREKFQIKPIEVTNDPDDDYDPLCKPKPDKKNAQKLSFISDSDDDDSDQDEEHQHGAESEANNRLNDLIPKSPGKRELSPESHKESKHKRMDNTESTKTKDIAKTPEDDVLTDKERKLRDIRAQIASIKQQIESESKESQSSRRKRGEDVKGDSETDKQRGNKVASDAVTDTSIKVKIAPKKSRTRERETVDMVQTFKKRLKQADSIQSGQPVGSKQDSNLMSDYDDELDALNKVDGDDWLTHEFITNDDNEEEEVMDEKSTKNRSYSNLRNVDTVRHSNDDRNKDQSSSSRHRDYNKRSEHGSGRYKRDGSSYDRSK